MTERDQEPQPPGDTTLEELDRLIGAAGDPGRRTAAAAPGGQPWQLPRRVDGALQAV